MQLEHQETAENNRASKSTNKTTEASDAPSEQAKRARGREREEGACPPRQGESGIGLVPTRPEVIRA